MNLLAQATQAVQEGKHVAETIDFVVIIAYMLFVLGFGSYFSRFGKSTKDFFFGGQRFSWWLIAMSLAATGVGSYSFLKYSEKGFSFGFSSGMSYTNDWFFIPFFMFGWLPIIYFARVRSVPEYFERRFNTPCRFMAVIIILTYMLGYVGYNLFTLGEAAFQVLGVDKYLAIVVIAVVSCIYITAGGQTAVIFTDLLQGFMLLLAGIILLALGLDFLALDGAIWDGAKNLWANFSLSERLPFAAYNKPSKFHSVGVFAQDGICGSIAFLFASQGLIMRFLAAKSMNEGRKCISFNILLMLPLSMLVVGNAGWICNAAVKMKLLESPDVAKAAFVHLTDIVCHPGVFGFVLAALSAAMMSTIDTLTNAVAALAVYDVYQPYMAPNKSDRHYLSAARVVTVIASVIGLILGILFASLETDLYSLHAAFQSVTTPPIVVAIFLGAFWKRYTPKAALATLVLGMVAVWLGMFFPKLVKPIADLHGVEPIINDEGVMQSYRYMTALYGVIVSAGIGVIVTFFTKPKPDSEIAGLVCSSLEQARKFFKGKEPNFKQGEKVRGQLIISEDGTAENVEVEAFAGAPDNMPKASYAVVRLSQAMMEKMQADEGDLIYIGDARWWLGGLRSLHARVGQPHAQGDDVVLIAADSFESGNFLPGKSVQVEKLL